MTDLHFNQICDVLKDIHEKFPDLRFGQVIQVALDTSHKRNNVNLNDVSSKKILAQLQDFNVMTNERRTKEIKKRESKVIKNGSTQLTPDNSNR